MSIESDIIQMVFGNEMEVSENTMSCFTHTNSRKRLKDQNKIYKDGITRYPEINNSTGTVALYFNLNVLKKAIEGTVLQILEKSYGLSEVDKKNGKTLGLYHGPPSLIVKPLGSSTSQPFIYSFQDLSKGTKYTVVKCESEHMQNTGKSNGSFEKLEGFDLYFDILDMYYDFESRVKYMDVFYLDSKWFNIDEAREIIEEYTAYYNYYERNLSCELEREIRTKVVEIYDEKKTVVPTTVVNLEWVALNCAKGTQFVFDSKTVLRTLSNKDTYSRIYVQIPMEPTPKKWNTSNEKKLLITAYKTGKFGNWARK